MVRYSATLFEILPSGPFWRQDAANGVPVAQIAFAFFELAHGHHGSRPRRKSTPRAIASFPQESQRQCQ
jgi:hypothetical protein